MALQIEKGAYIEYVTVTICGNAVALLPRYSAYSNVHSNVSFAAVLLFACPLSTKKRIPGRLTVPCSSRARITRPAFFFAGSVRYVACLFNLACLEAHTRTGTSHYSSHASCTIARNLASFETSTAFLIRVQIERRNDFIEFDPL